MSDSKTAVGRINWTDLTVDDATQVRDFYRGVVGWNFSEFDMGGYSDYCMNLPEGGQTVAGICHRRGGNADLPPQWLVYINVANLDESIARCTELGGEVLGKVRDMGGEGRYCIIKDPAGAVAGLFEHAKKD